MNNSLDQFRSSACADDTTARRSVAELKVDGVVTTSCSAGLKMELRSAVVAFGILLGCLTAAEADVAPHPMTFQGYAPAVPATMGTAWTIFGDGVIDKGTSDRLHEFLTANDVTNTSTLYLNSLGGSLTEGIALGRLIRQSELFTYVGRSGDKPDDIKSGECYSACALAFLGGLFRFGHAGSLYGVHRFYASPTGGMISSDQAQIISAAIVEYIRGMGVNPSLFTFMTEAGGDEIKLLSYEEQLRLNVINNGEGPTTWTIESLQSTLYLKGTRDTWRGMNKFIIICETKGRVFLETLYNAERRGRKF